MDEEIWKPVVGYEDLYHISSLGNVLKLPSGKLMKPYKNKGGYIKVSLTKDGQKKCFSVHRLVAAAFLGEIYDQVDHINGDRANNRLENLRLCTRRENQIFRYNSEYPGAFYNKPKKKWFAGITVNNKSKHLGYFPDAESAHKAYMKAREIYK